MKTISLRVNNQEYQVEINEDMRLLDVLRDKLGFTGVKEGCAEGECGACSVIMDGELVASCLIMAFQAEGKDILTIEGLQGDNGGIHPIQQAFLDEGAVQCGFCTPAMVLAAKALLDKKPKPTKDEIREGLSGNLCRCTGYNKIVSAVERASEYLAKGGI